MQTSRAQSSGADIDRGSPLDRLGFGILRKYSHLVEARVRTLSKSAQNPIRRFTGNRIPRPVLGIIGVLVSLLLGYWAQVLAQIEAEENWYRNNQPSTALFDGLMRSHGLALLSDPPTLSKVQRGLPGTLDEKGSIWVLEKGDWVTVFDPTNENESHRVYCRDCKKPPSRNHLTGIKPSWEPLGSGWRGFESLIQMLGETRRNPTQPSKKLGKDPREILY